MAIQPTLPFELSRELIALPTHQLLAKFGEGGHAPGSGSAAALMGLLAAQLITTVCKISSASDVDRRFSFVRQQVEDREISRLETLFQQDAEYFDKVIRTRKLRDEEQDPVQKRRLRELALRQLQESTDIVFAISRICLSLVGYGLVVFDSGAKKVRGDSGAAISASIAGAMSAVFIINLNLRSFKGGRWAIRKQLQVEELQAEIVEKQEDAFARITTLKPEQANGAQGSLFE